MHERIYLDWNATTPLRPQARQAMVAACYLPGNPSSVHAEGRQARGVVEQARAIVAEALGTKPRNVVFTSGISNPWIDLLGYSLQSSAGF